MGVSCEQYKMRWRRSQGLEHAYIPTPKGGGFTRILINMGEVRIIDSSAIGLLVATANTLTTRHGKALILCGTTPQVAASIAMMQLHHFFRVEKNEADALTAVHELCRKK